MKNQSPINKTDPAISEAARAMGRVKTEKKAAAVRKNGLATRFQTRSIDSYVCTCDGGESIDPFAHKTTCHRGRILRQRARKKA